LQISLPMPARAMRARCSSSIRHATRLRPRAGTATSSAWCTAVSSRRIDASLSCCGSDVFALSSTARPLKARQNPYAAGLGATASARHHNAYAYTTYHGSPMRSFDKPQAVPPQFSPEPTAQRGNSASRVNLCLGTFSREDITWAAQRTPYVSGHERRLYAARPPSWEWRRREPSAYTAMPGSRR
jgi:hypothetical protein